MSGPWYFRDERMYLIPGDSPMGYRLPLESLPWVSSNDYPWQHTQDPFAPLAPLRPATQLRMQYGTGLTFSPVASTRAATGDAAGADNGVSQGNGPAAGSRAESGGGKVR